MDINDKAVRSWLPLARKWGVQEREPGGFYAGCVSNNRCLGCSPVGLYGEYFGGTGAPTYRKIRPTGERVHVQVSKASRQLLGGEGTWEL
jgi:hypothetical protein